MKEEDKEESRETEGSKDEKRLEEGTDAGQENQKTNENDDAEREATEAWANTRTLMGFLYADFHSDRWYYEGVFLLFKLVFMLCLLFQEVATKNFLMTACLFLHTLMFVRSMPFFESRLAYSSKARVLLHSQSLGHPDAADLPYLDNRFTL